MKLKTFSPHRTISGNTLRKMPAIRRMLPRFQFKDGPVTEDSQGRVVKPRDRVEAVDGSFSMTVLIVTKVGNLYVTDAPAECEIKDFSAYEIYQVYPHEIKKISG